MRFKRTADMLPPISGMYLTYQYDKPFLVSWSTKKGYWNTTDEGEGEHKIEPLTFWCWHGPLPEKEEEVRIEELREVDT